MTWIEEKQIAALPPPQQLCESTHVLTCGLSLLCDLAPRAANAKVTARVHVHTKATAAIWIMGFVIPKTDEGWD